MPPLLQAFLIGLISACSLPLGALTSLFWKPGDRTIAFLMSFGGGALLAALTIDLAGPALERGHFSPLAIGCVVGGALFVVLNQIVNERGGFLRKVSTTVFYVRGQRQKRHQRFIANMSRLDVFQGLPEYLLRRLAESSSSRKVPVGATIFRRGDPGTHLYVVEEGEVELPAEHGAEARSLQPGDAFGFMAFFTGSRHARSEVTKEDATLLALPRSAFREALQDSPELREATTKLLTREKIQPYLTGHGMTEAEIAAWINAARQSVRDRGELPDIDRPISREQFLQSVDGIRRVPFFSHLPPDEAEDLAAKVFLKRHEAGHTFFNRDEPADRMYIVQEGEVRLLDTADDPRSAKRLGENEAFGGLSFLTGAPHSATAVCAKETTVWVLRRVDFDDLLEHCPNLSHAVQDFVRKEEVADYLRRRHHFDPDKATAWVNDAVRSIDMGRLVTPVGAAGSAAGMHHGAPLAIWLGILLDGVPESVVIGSSLIHN